MSNNVPRELVIFGEILQFRTPFSNEDSSSYFTSLVDYVDKYEPSLACQIKTMGKKLGVEYQG